MTLSTTQMTRSARDVRHRMTASTLIVTQSLVRISRIGKEKKERVKIKFSGACYSVLKIGRQGISSEESPVMGWAAGQLWFDLESRGSSRSATGSTKKEIWQPGGKKRKSSHLSSPEVIDTTEGLLRINHVEIDDGVDRDGHGVACQDLEQGQRSGQLEKAETGNEKGKSSPLVGARRSWRYAGPRSGRCRCTGWRWRCRGPSTRPYVADLIERWLPVRTRRQPLEKERNVINRDRKNIF